MPGTPAECPSPAAPATDRPLERFYRPELDLLRFAAFLMVFLTHTLWGQPARYLALGLPPWLAEALAASARAGAYGVDLFFTLSSYLITTLLLREYRQRGSIDVRAFYARRILRIWPLYFLFLLVVVPAVHALLPHERLSAGYLAAFLLLCGNWACALHGYQPNSAMPLWSVSIEEQFYLAWPLLMSRWLHRIGLISAGMLLSANLARLLLVAYRFSHPLASARPEIWCDTLARLDPLAVGALVALWCDRRPLLRGALLRGSAGCAAAALLFAAARWGALEGWRALYSYPAVALAGGLVLLSVLELPLPRAPLVRFLAHLGKISYGLYVFHQACLVVCWPEHPAAGRALLAKLAGFLLTIAAGLVSYRYFESPFLRYKERFARVLSRPA